MKKVLCGLVLALMMAGNGYADITYEECKYLKNEAESNVRQGRNYNLGVNREADRLAKEGNKDYTSIEVISKYELDALKKAHYLADIYSVLCD